MTEPTTRDDGFPTECDFCGFEGVETHDYTDSYPTGEKFGGNLCVVCASTHGAAHFYPEQHPGEIYTLKTLGWGINAILQAIEEKTQ